MINNITCNRDLLSLLFSYVYIVLDLAIVYKPTCSRYVSLTSTWFYTHYYCDSDISRSLLLFLLVSSTHSRVTYLFEELNNQSNNLHHPYSPIIPTLLRFTPFPRPNQQLTPIYSKRWTDSEVPGLVEAEGASNVENKAILHENALHPTAYIKF